MPGMSPPMPRFINPNSSPWQQAQDQYQSQLDQYRYRNEQAKEDWNNRAQAAQYTLAASRIPGSLGQSSGGWGGGGMGGGGGGRIGGGGDNAYYQQMADMIRMGFANPLGSLPPGYYNALYRQQQQPTPTPGTGARPMNMPSPGGGYGMGMGGYGGR